VNAFNHDYCVVKIRYCQPQFIVWGYNCIVTYHYFNGDCRPSFFLFLLIIQPQPQQQSSGSSQTAPSPIPSPPPQWAPILGSCLASVHSQSLYLALFLPTEPGPSPFGHVCNPSHTASTTDLTNQQFSGAWTPCRHPLPR